MRRSDELFAASEVARWLHRIDDPIVELDNTRVTRRQKFSFNRIDFGLPLLDFGVIRK